jgi:hypothetical protein
MLIGKSITFTYHTRIQRLGENKNWWNMTSLGLRPQHIQASGNDHDRIDARNQHNHEMTMIVPN